MAYVNVLDWSVEQVTEWLKGLDSTITPYAKSFLNNEVKGHQLLNLRSDDLENLGVVTLGHQELILEAVEFLRNFHYKLDKENLQMLALRLSCASISLCKELTLADENCTIVSTQTMSDVHNVIAAIKPLIHWLDRSPFRGDKDYMDCKTQLLQLSVEMATSAHRDIFSEKPIRAIRNISDTLAKLADHIIQEITDPMILQPASLALATLKKKEQDLGFCLMPTNCAVHQIVDIKYGSPAHNSSKIEEGDEIVQVNYQTVVGWQRKNVLLLLQESPPEIVLTLKKRPRHTKVYGQIYMKPYRLPSKKRATPYSRWNDNLPSPQLLAIHDLPQIPAPRLPTVVAAPEIETDISSSSDSEPLDSPLDGGPGRVYPLKPRPVLQRRNTITGASPTNKRPHQAIEQYWQQLKNQAASKHTSAYNIECNTYEESALLRDKSASCGDTFDFTPRPTTAIGLTHTKSINTDFKNHFHEKSLKKKKVNFQDLPKEEHLHSNNTNLNEEHSISVNSLSSLNEAIDFIDEGVDLTDRSNMKVEWQKQIVEEIIDAINYESSAKLHDDLDPIKDASLADVHVHNIIKKFDDQHLEATKPKIYPKNLIEKPPELPQKPTKKPVVPPKTSKVRGTLNKSYSTPAYDQGSDNSNESIKESDHLDIPKSNLFNSVISNEPIKYELGIPIVESNLHSVLSSKNNHDIPPKPPPRVIYPNNTLKYKHTTETSHNFTKIESSKDASLNSSSSYSSSSMSKSQTSTECLSRVDYATNECQRKTKLAGSTDNLNNFEPRNVSTPLKPSKADLDNESHYCKISTYVEHNKINTENKISPTNSIVRAMMYSSKSKSVKKKNSLIAKRRQVSARDITPGELEGYLYQRLRSRQTQTVHWEKRWFVLNGSSLYGFKTKESHKAECLIFLSGYTVSIATEVKSRTNAFKVYHTGTVFYFSTENPETLTSWIELITAATLLYDNKLTGEVALYSETDDSDFEKPKSMSSDRNTDSLKKVGNTNKKPAQNGSSSLDRKWFFNKSNCTLPVPTAQFRSYRKIPSTISVTESVSTGNFTSHIPDFSPRFELQSKSTSSTSLISDLNIEEDENHSVKNKQKPLNYVHASNPNLCDITDFHLRSFNKIQTFQPCSDNLAGFVTLEELMIRQSEEQKLNPHNKVVINPSLIRPDVVYGEVPIRSTEQVKKPTHSRTVSDCSDAIASTSSNSNKSLQVDETTTQTNKSRDSTSFCFGKRPSFKKHKKEKDTYDVCTYPKPKGYEEKLNKSLPRTHKLNTANKEYSVSYIDLKDKSSELVYSKQTHNNTNFAKNRSLERKVTRQHSLTQVDKKQTKSYGYVPGNSSERAWIDSLRKTEKLDKSIKTKLKSAGQYTPMALPLTPDPKLNPTFAFELNLDEKVSKGNKLKNFFKSDHKKDKQITSPIFQRKVFQNREEELQWGLNANQDEFHLEPDFCYKVVENTSLKSQSFHSHPSTDYPGLEYPPVFEPETYSLSDPQCSISLLRKQEKNN